MTEVVQPGTVKIWFGLLQMAIRQGVPINEGKYRSWGTVEELQSLKFQTWWRLRGKALFESAVSVATIDRVEVDALVVRIPTALDSRQIKDQVSALMAKHRGTKRIKERKPLGLVGDAKYKQLKQYERYLEIEFDPKNTGKTIEEKTEAFREKYKKIHARRDKQVDTMEKAGVRYVNRKPLKKHFRARDPEAFDRYRDSSGKLMKVTGELMPKGINAKKVSRWRLSGKLLLLNVASGEFPGRDYYGSNLSGKLEKRLKALGMKELATVAPNKGGGRTRSELRLQYAPTKAELKARAALSDKLYGVDVLGGDKRGASSLGKRSKS